MSTATADDYDGPPVAAAPVVVARRPAVLREVTALLLIIAGVTGLIFVGFSVSVEAGIAVCSVVAIITGTVLGLDR